MTDQLKLVMRLSGMLLDGRIPAQELERFLVTRTAANFPHWREFEVGGVDISSLVGRFRETGEIDQWGDIALRGALASPSRPQGVARFARATLAELGFEHAPTYGEIVERVSRFGSICTLEDVLKVGLEYQGQPGESLGFLTSVETGGQTWDFWINWQNSAPLLTAQVSERMRFSLDARIVFRVG